MATEATFTVASSEFPLGSVFEKHPEVMVELERIVPGPRLMIPYVWVRGLVNDDVLGSFREHSGVKKILLVDSIEDAYLLRVEWDPNFAGLLLSLAETNLTLISATGTYEQWTLEVRGDDRNDIAEFQTLCLERDIPVTLTALHDLTPVEPGIESTLTDAQKEALLLAFERGYFNSPRDVTMEELGEELDISAQAVASRLRRGIKHVLTGTVSVLKPK